MCVCGEGVYVELCVAMKMKGERERERTRSSACVFLQQSSQPYLMAGHRFTQIITGIVKHEVTSLSCASVCVCFSVRVCGGREKIEKLLHPTH